MARGSGKAVNNLVKLGVKYGPLVYEAVKHGKEPARQLAEREVARANSRRRALEHAHHLVDGSVLTVFDGDQRLFVVFNGDNPVASHPASSKPLASLIEGYDLDKRVRPARDRRRIGPRVKQVGGQGRTLSSPPSSQPSSPPPSSPPSAPPTAGADE
ncbi:hypothetical protein [Arsenicicoccus sp. oral taxon 190]|uniref:hypothetical protein n=1 Tax=Arsenicicoccus sp. oral taxon 190 TaxID=1658671 RepID=UPI00067D9127|nr:hypothetical protein [Arsenicicoccus sp. oral taxon 190]